jgi:hypothetical protein
LDFSKQAKPTVSPAAQISTSEKRVPSAINRIPGTACIVKAKVASVTVVSTSTTATSDVVLAA